MTMNPVPAVEGSPRQSCSEPSEALAIRRAFLGHLFYTMGRFPEVATRNDLYSALAHVVRDQMVKRWICSSVVYRTRASRTVCYLSAEFMIGPQLGMNLEQLGMAKDTREALAGLGVSLDDLIAQEEEPGLGTGGLGRLAACFMESLATLQIPAIGYGIRYEFGIFDQAIRDGWQIELADNWLRLGNPWEVVRPEISFDVGLGGTTDHYVDERGRYRVRWRPAEVVRGVACDTPVVGYRVGNANFLRLWKAEAPCELDLSRFNTGDYYRAVEDKIRSESLSKLLYPNPEPKGGMRLRLAQQYFLVSCALRDMLRIFLQSERDLSRFSSKYAIQLNDTHPALAVPELMRLLIDEHDLGWDEAWAITTCSFGYTNHTLLPEALEAWPVELFQQLLPRHFEIVLEMNRRLLDVVRERFPGDERRVARMSMIDETNGNYVRMANVASAGSSRINGVSRLHSKLLRSSVLPDFFSLWPEKFTNVTNGVSHRRFLLLANPRLARVLNGAIGDGWIGDLEQLRRLEGHLGDRDLRRAWREAKAENKIAFARLLRERAGTIVDPASLFDVQAKRIHEYKRQHLNLLHVITLYGRLRRGEVESPVPRTVILAGKAPPSYRMAKLMIRLATGVAEVVNGDARTNDALRVVFYPDLNVKNAEPLYPAADLSEQISTAGKEASGTGNMKLAMNGAVTIGTMDGANIELFDAVGAEGCFAFGATADEVERLRYAGYRPRSVYETNAELREAIDQIAAGAFTRGDKRVLEPLVAELLGDDRFMVLADYEAYVECQERVAAAYRDVERWTTMSMLNVARVGRFSSDRAVREYASEVWQVQPVPVDPDETPAALAPFTGRPLRGA
jgi:glycogen phosphorylase